MVQKVGNNFSKDDVAVEFVKFDPSKPEEMNKLQKIDILIKEKIVVKEREIPSQEMYKYKPGHVVAEVQTKLGKSFTITMHTNCWKRYGSRPQ